MKLDIHRHAKNPGNADVVMRNLFHNQAAEIESGRFYSAGLHPWHVKEDTLKSDLASLREMLARSEVIAVGEAGLDKTIDAPMELQHSAFKQQIQMAAEFNKPMIIHCVRAYNEVFQMHQEANHKQPWIIHWFNASAQMGEQLIAKNFFLSFGHKLFNYKSKAYKAFASLPLDKIFFETDDSAYTITQVYEKAANIRHCDVVKLEEQVSINFQKCFGFSYE